MRQGIGIVFVVFVLAAMPAVAKDIYIAERAMRSDTGVDCATAHSAAWFNDPNNWISGTDSISPGDIVHLCGTFRGALNSTMLTIQGSGSADNPITILFEPGAVLSAPAWNRNGA